MPWHWFLTLATYCVSVWTFGLESTFDQPFDDTFTDLGETDYAEECGSIPDR